MSDVEIFGAMIEGLELVTKVLAIYADVDRNLLTGSSVMKTQLSAAILKLYSLVLEFLARARVYYAQNTISKSTYVTLIVRCSESPPERVAKGIVQPAELSVNGYLRRILKQDDEVHKMVELVAWEG